MPSTTPPLILLVPGAFGTPACYDPILPYLKAAGLSTHPGPYPSCNPLDPSTATCEKDIASLRQLLVSLLEERDVVILAHSYGGIVAGGAAKGLDKPTRTAQGQAAGGGVVGLIYVVGNIALDNESLVEAIGGAYPPFIKLDKPSKGLSLIEPAMDILYNDCDAALGPELEGSVLPHANLAFETKATAPAWADPGFDGKRVYVRTLDDCCNPLFVQDLWLDKTKVKWDVVELKAGHMPFFSQPEALASKIVEATRRFMVL